MVGEHGEVQVIDWGIARAPRQTGVGWTSLDGAEIDPALLEQALDVGGAVHLSLVRPRDRRAPRELELRVTVGQRRVE